MAKDSRFTAVHRARVLLDVVDDAWLADKLSDDEIDVPVEHQVTDEMLEDALEEDESGGKGAENRWDELALSSLLDEPLVQRDTQPPTAPPSVPNTT